MDFTVVKENLDSQVIRYANVGMLLLTQVTGYCHGCKCCPQGRKGLSGFKGPSGLPGPEVSLELVSWPFFFHSKHQYIPISQSQASLRGCFLPTHTSDACVNTELRDGFHRPVKYVQVACIVRNEWTCSRCWMCGVRIVFVALHVKQFSDNL